MGDAATPSDHTIEPGRGWPEAIRADLAANRRNPRVGTRLLHTDGRVRVWEIRLGPGERLGFHRHVLDYLWVATTPGTFVSRQEDGTMIEATVAAGQTSSSTYGPGGSEVHDLENVGATGLVFTTVEFLRSADPPPPIPDAG